MKAAVEELVRYFLADVAEAAEAGAASDYELELARRIQQSEEEVPF